MNGIFPSSFRNRLALRQSEQPSRSVDAVPDSALSHLLKTPRIHCCRPRRTRSRRSPHRSSYFECSDSDRIDAASIGFVTRSQTAKPRPRISGVLLCVGPRQLASARFDAHDTPSLCTSPETNHAVAVVIATTKSAFFLCYGLAVSSSPRCVGPVRASY